MEPKKIQPTSKSSSSPALPASQNPGPSYERLEFFRAAGSPIPTSSSAASTAPPSSPPSPTTTPVVLAMLANTPPTARLPPPGPVAILSGSAPQPAAVLASVEALGFSVKHGYGVTETGSFAVSCAWRAEQWDGLPAEERAWVKERQWLRTAVIEGADVIDGESGERVARNGDGGEGGAAWRVRDDGLSQGRGGDDEGGEGRVVRHGLRT